MSDERRVRIARDGQEQTVSIPREFALPGDEAILRREAGRLIVEPAPRRSTRRRRQSTDRRESTMSMQLNEIEKEIVVLNAVWGLINSLVNSEMLTIGNTDPTNVRFKSTTHAQMFNVLLVDLLSKIDRKGFGTDQTYLGAIGEIVEYPRLGEHESVQLLWQSVTAFREWLEKPFTIEQMWLPSIWSGYDIDLKRIDMIKISGNICRHNVLRSAGTAMSVRTLLCCNEIKIDLGQSLLLLSEINEWLHDKVFIYHSSTIAEFLNNIRWGIHGYLYPECLNSVKIIGKISGDLPRYRYVVPPDIHNEYARHCYRGMMDQVRHRPYMRKFRVHDFLKRRY